MRDRKVSFADYFSEPANPSGIIGSGRKAKDMIAIREIREVRMKIRLGLKFPRMNELNK